MDSKGVYLSSIFPEVFLKPVYPTMILEKFQIYGIKITGKYICESKVEFFKQNSPPGSYHYLPGRRKLPIPPELRFLKINFFSSRNGGGGGLWSWKNDQN